MPKWELIGVIKTSHAIDGFGVGLAGGLCNFGVYADGSVIHTGNKRHYAKCPIINDSGMWVSSILSLLPIVHVATWRMLKTHDTFKRKKWYITWIFFILDFWYDSAQLRPLGDIMYDWNFATNVNQVCRLWTLRGPNPLCCICYRHHLIWQRFQLMSIQWKVISINGHLRLWL